MNFPADSGLFVTLPQLMELLTVIHLLGGILGDVICELESPELFATEERIRVAAKERRGGRDDAARQLGAQVEALNVSDARAVAAAARLRNTG